jgi:dihydroneopterin aldolase/2-amino-4-hydroxy-6-hydroxymethyldihydropteridine diphosphokinase
VTDRIVLNGVEAVGHHGVFEHEKSAGQRFVVDVVLEADLRRAGASDDLRDTVDYSGVAAAVVERIEGQPFDLVERLAEVIAGDLLEHTLVDAVDVTVHKPQAPMPVAFADLSVRVRRERGVPVVVALGGNLGDRVATLHRAVADLRALPGLRVTAVSSLVETDPVGGPEQPDYLNAILLATTTLEADQLLAALHAIEARHGRERNERWGSRSLDLDLVQYGRPGTPAERRSADQDVRLPHPRAAERPFVLVPWAQVDPEAVLRLGPAPSDQVRSVADVLAGLDTSGVRPGPDWPPW